MRSDAAWVFEANSRDKVGRRNPAQALAFGSHQVMRREASRACSRPRASLAIGYIIRALQAIHSPTGIYIIPSHAVTVTSISKISIADRAVGMVELEAFLTIYITGQAGVAHVRLEVGSACSRACHGRVGVEGGAGVGAVLEADVEDVDVRLHELAVLFEEGS